MSCLVTFICNFFHDVSSQYKENISTSGFFTFNSFSRHFVCYAIQERVMGSVEINDCEKGLWRLTGFYGYPNGSRRRVSWDLLRHLSSQSMLPWCIFCDFNDIVDASEKRGRNICSNWLIRQAVLDSGLSDVPVEGYPFTWFKSLGTPRAVEERLDRALATAAWFDFFPNSSLVNMAAPASEV